MDLLPRPDNRSTMSSVGADHIDDQDVYWNRLGYQNHRYIVHIKAHLEGRRIEFLGRFSPQGVLDGEVRRTLKVDSASSDDRELLSEILDFVRQNWHTDRRFKLHPKGNDVYGVDVSGSLEYEIRVRRRDYNKPAAQLAIDFERDGNKLMLPFGDVIREMILKAAI